MSRLYCRNRRGDRYAEKRGFRLAHAACRRRAVPAGQRLVSLDATPAGCEQFPRTLGARPLEQFQSEIALEHFNFEKL